MIIRLEDGLKVIKRPLMTSGGLCEGPVILIDSDQTPQEEAVAIWHEVVHLLQDAGGFDQDEESVEAAAQKLAASCPEVIDWVYPKENEHDTTTTAGGRGPDKGIP